MILLVDTSVWIDFFAGRRTREASILKEGVEEGADVALTRLVLAEILQGVPSDREFARLREALVPFRVLLPASDQTFVKAASLYRAGRKRGVTIRSLVDCVIAAIAMDHDAVVLHRDRDYDRIATFAPLKVVTTLS